MRRKKPFKRGLFVPILVAGLVSYLIGGRQPPAQGNMGLSAAQSVALRFPQDWAEAPAATAFALQPQDASGTMGDIQFALFSPEPMARGGTAPAVQPPPQPAMQLAALEDVKTAPASDTAAHVKTSAAALAAAKTIKPAAAATHRSANRPGYVLDDAQIASIKQRLHLTPDQEAMWPAVEAALRNIAYAKAQEARRRGTPGATPVASIDPDSVEVQGLKSAAVPLIMSFNYEQKEEVRNLAHVMGLDQLASQF